MTSESKNMVALLQNDIERQGYAVRSLFSIFEGHFIASGQMLKFDQPWFFTDLSFLFVSWKAKN